MTIETIAVTRQDNARSVVATARTSAATLVAAVEALSATQKAIRSHTDSAASVWIEVDGKALDEADIAGIQMAGTASEAHAEAEAILARS